MIRGQDIIGKARQALDLETYRDQHWTGTLSQYLDIVREDPRVTRSAFERIYDMILSHGTHEYVDNKKKIVHYKFFDDPDHASADAIYGLDIALMKMVNIFKSAAKRYGTERRVILLHGPVGSSKSTIARLLKTGLEAYSRKAEGKLYTFGWLRDRSSPGSVVPCPMHEEPLTSSPTSCGRSSRRASTRVGPRTSTASASRASFAPSVVRSIATCPSVTTATGRA
jgi:serine protein kinase